MSDPEIAPRVDPDHANLLSSLEDHDVTNQFSAMGSLKPGLFRRLTMILVLCAIDYTARHILTAEGSPASLQFSSRAGFFWMTRSA